MVDLGLPHRLAGFGLRDFDPNTAEDFFEDVDRGQASEIDRSAGPIKKDRSDVLQMALQRRV